MPGSLSRAEIRHIPEDLPPDPAFIEGDRDNYGWLSSVLEQVAKAESCPDAAERLGALSLPGECAPPENWQAHIADFLAYWASTARGRLICPPDDTRWRFEPAADTSSAA